MGVLFSKSKKACSWCTGNATNGSKFGTKNKCPCGSSKVQQDRRVRRTESQAISSECLQQIDGIKQSLWSITNILSERLKEQQNSGDAQEDECLNKILEYFIKETNALLCTMRERKARREFMKQPAPNVRPGIQTIKYSADCTAPANTHSVLTLKENIDVLRHKCRLKDHMILLLADELRLAYSKCKWNGVLHFKNNKPQDIYDFNRYTLARYLKGEPIPTLFSVQPENPEYPMLYCPDGRIQVRKIGRKAAVLSRDPKAAGDLKIFVDGCHKDTLNKCRKNKTILYPIDLMKNTKISVVMPCES